MEKLMADLIQQCMEESRLKAIAVYAELYGYPVEEVECALSEIGPDSPTITWYCWRRGSFHRSDHGELDLGLLS